MDTVAQFNEKSAGYGYTCQFAQTNKDITAAQELRARAFGLSRASDVDAFDENAEIVLIKDPQDRVVATFRFIELKSGAQIETSYAAAFYDLSALGGYLGKMLEIGRFCVDPNIKDPLILRVAWAEITRLVMDHNIDFLFGCTSFHGNDAQYYEDSFSLLASKHVAPEQWRPRQKDLNVFSFARRPGTPFDLDQALTRMPPLLKSYLIMGGWVSDHAVIDDHMNTLHVFTGVEIASIPPARRKRLVDAIQAKA